MQGVLWTEAGGSRAGAALFTVTMTEHWHRLSREVVSNLGDTQNPPGHGKLLCVGDPALIRWLDGMISKGLFQPQMILWCKHVS